jgi:hypothetical protein
MLKLFIRYFKLFIKSAHIDSLELFQIAKIVVNKLTKRYN